MTTKLFSLTTITLSLFLSGCGPSSRVVNFIKEEAQRWADEQSSSKIGRLKFVVDEIKDVQVHKSNDQIFGPAELIDAVVTFKVPNENYYENVGGLNNGNFPFNPLHSSGYNKINISSNALARLDKIANTKDVEEHLTRIYKLQIPGFCEYSPDVMRTKLTIPVKGALLKSGEGKLTFSKYLPSDFISESALKDSGLFYLNSTHYGTLVGKSEVWVEEFKMCYERLHSLAGDYEAALRRVSWEKTEEYIKVAEEKYKLLVEELYTSLNIRFIRLGQDESKWKKYELLHLN